MISEDDQPPSAMETEVKKEETIEEPKAEAFENDLHLKTEKEEAKGEAEVPSPEKMDVEIDAEPESAEGDLRKEEVIVKEEIYVEGITETFDEKVEVKEEIEELEGK